MKIFLDTSSLFKLIIKKQAQQNLKNYSSLKKL